MLKKSGISIAPEFAQVDGRILPAPKLKAGRGRDLFVKNGRWNFNSNGFIRACSIKKRAVANFSDYRDARDLARRIIHCGNTKGMQIDREQAVFEEKYEMKREAARTRVDAMCELMESSGVPEPTFILCLLPEEKNCDLYGPWKRKCLTKYGIITQCMAPGKKNINDQYITNLLLKINAKLGGLNSLLQNEESSSIPLVSRTPTIIFGMDVSHGAPGSNVKSVAAVVSSLGWPNISQYGARVCNQQPRREMIDSLLKMEEGTDCGIIRELNEDFRRHTRQLPEQIIIFRLGIPRLVHKKIDRHSAASIFNEENENDNR